MYWRWGWRCGSACKSSTVAMRIRPVPPPKPSARSCGQGASLLLLRLAPDQHLGVTLEIVRENAHRARGPRQLLQRVAQVLRRRRVGAEECGVGVLEHA